MRKFMFFFVTVLCIGCARHPNPNDVIKLNIGMTSQQVIAVMGNPRRLVAIKENLNVWEYGVCEDASYLNDTWIRPLWVAFWDDRVTKIGDPSTFADPNAPNAIYEYRLR